MKLRAQIDGESQEIEVKAVDQGQYDVRIGDRTLSVDMRKVGRRTYSLLVERRSFEVRLTDDPGLAASDDGSTRTTISLYDDEYVVELVDPRRARAGIETRKGQREVQKVTAPMPGRIVRVLVEAGSTVRRGQGILVIEAMKMENELKAARDGVVRDLRARPGDSVNQGTVLAIVEPPA